LLLHNKQSKNISFSKILLELTDDVINAQAFLFFLGFETTASLLRYAAYVLATHPDIDSKLYDEVVDNIGEVSDRV